ncbi:E3 ubiquitin-protein ligase TRIM7-like [Sceloporus undulatus]|uniref:E3 ubiquitin-protein ligase TRIM7-like n=1 Tax=Sceloporus undulatus TaxID=8520 RepID=UPI001C4DD6F4|nr:E3 ubiquitin-protein ligase TRIM7-like [Sceloporus undulatus]XP_042306705.1 E3 ubiquitin-protein ligase TRIM7-like [Sceloporus undulatus]XP_042306706.1 E3 ubiquitin-protein ligase TRIM7-like [Sceloporus undulatus]XP_042306707.1 E3 ubiquitin-protein ligase TRIM7-like [Sceloporus undulatus]XP_042306708.1 E3 ubiquitin-protein ligase TRIM7-like [Sceloporus undulatus]
MAAAEDHFQDLCEEALCTICLEYLQNPVTIECGHNFCHDCLTQFWRQLKDEATCPQCRVAIQQRNVIPNWQLARFVEITQKLSRQTRKRKGDCDKHQEPLKLFCKEDKTSICVVCDRSKEHRDHQVVPVEEVSQEYKDLISSSLEVLKKEREKCLTYKSETENESQDLLKQTEAEMEKAVAEFRQLHQFLEEQEKLLLSRMEEVKKEVSKKRDEYLARLSGELSSLESLIQEMEEKKQQPASELLQDVKAILQRSEEKVSFENPLAFSVELRWKLWDICDINPLLVSVMKQFKDALIPGLQLQKANVTLDPDTAHPKLILSRDKKSVACGAQYRDLPDNLERFNKAVCVLGCEEFTAGRYFWEISVGREKQWLAGVSRKSVKRKGDIAYGPEGGIWAIGKWGGQYKATNHPCYPALSSNRELKKIRVSLNCPGGQVAFYDADTGEHLYTFSGASFMGETLLPFFNVHGEGHLLICP